MLGNLFRSAANALGGGGLGNFLQPQNLFQSMLTKVIGSLPIVGGFAKSQVGQALISAGTNAAFTAATGGAGLFAGFSATQILEATNVVASLTKQFGISSLMPSQLDSVVKTVLDGGDPSSILKEIASSQLGADSPGGLGGFLQQGILNGPIGGDALNLSLDESLANLSNGESIFETVLSENSLASILDSVGPISVPGLEGVDSSRLAEILSSPDISETLKASVMDAVGDQLSLDQLGNYLPLDVENIQPSQILTSFAMDRINLGDSALVGEAA